MGNESHTDKKMVYIYPHILRHKEQAEFWSAPEFKDSEIVYLSNSQRIEDIELQKISERFEEIKMYYPEDEFTLQFVCMGYTPFTVSAASIAVKMGIDLVFFMIRPGLLTNKMEKLTVPFFTEQNTNEKKHTKNSIDRNIRR